MLFKLIFQLIATLAGHTELVSSLAIVPSNKLIVSSSDFLDATIKVWNSTTFQFITSLSGHYYSVRSLAIIPSNENIVSGSADATIKVWDSTTFELIANLFGHTDTVNALAIIPSNENIVSGSDDTTIKVWNSKTYQLITSLIGHTNTITSLAILPLTETIVSGSLDQTIKVWDILYLNIDDEILDLKFLSDFHLATLSRNGIIRVWNIYTCDKISEFKNNIQIRNHFSFDYFSDTGELAYSETRSIKILNASFFFFYVSDIN